ncbi:MAG: BON domain-containing protein [Gammaproteobacteria bacterium]|nr:BON domain-containing protein [Gammaproteobacteria bacterium]
MHPIDSSSWRARAAAALLGMAAVLPAAAHDLRQRPSWQGALLKTADKDRPQPIRDAYLEGRIAGALALDPQVSVFDIDVEVKNGVAFLSGAVGSKVERDIAKEVARGVEGVTEVRNSIQVQEQAPRQRRERRTIGQAIDDAAIAGSVKSSLLANENTGGLEIHVTARDGLVTLTGTVKSEAEKQLAGLIAKNASGVTEVRNELAVGGGRK